MTHLIQLGHFSNFDLLALGFLGLCWLAIRWTVENPPAGRPSVSVLMAHYRREWMRQFITRQPRIFDATIMDNLRQGTAFFASACMIAIGGGLALIGNTERLLGLAEDLTLDRAPAVVWEVKILFVMGFVTLGFLNFLWAHRLFGYCAIVMAAVPNDPTDPATTDRTDQAAFLNIHAARSFNRGLRNIYFALATIAWLLGPLSLVVGTVLTVIVLVRREFWSQSRAMLMRNTPK
jgi:uncharacterized membrane protein